MTFILDMSSGKEYPGEELSCPNRATEKIRQPEVARETGDPALQLVTIEATDSEKQPAGVFPGSALDALLKSIEA